MTASHTGRAVLTGWDKLGSISVAAARLAVIPVFAALAAGVAVPAPVQAEDYALIQFGPTGKGTGATYDSYDREFIREWEANPPKGFATLSKQNIEPTKAAIARYSEIVKSGGWLSIPPGDNMVAGMSSASVARLRARLIKSGELAKSEGVSDYFDYDLEKAVKRFQASNGLTPTGIVDKRTRAALNVPASARLTQLKVNVSRLRDLTGGLAKRHVVVNIPAAQIEAIEDGSIVARYAGVVGKIDRQTPLTRSAITDLNFNPVWTLPPTVISEDLIPRGRQMQSKKENVLVKFGIDAYDGTTGKKVDPKKVDWTKVRPGTYTYRQQPGKENPMGFLRINFNSAHSVYMHDTPSDRVFGRNYRSASSGCIRVNNIEHFATWLLRGKKGWSKEAVLGLKASGKRKDVRLSNPVQLHMVYVTAWATEDGVVQFRRDLYQRDGIGAVAAAY